MIRAIHTKGAISPQKRARSATNVKRQHYEAKEMISKKGKAPPNTYEAICTMVDGFWGFVATYFGEDSSVTED